MTAEIKEQAPSASEQLITVLKECLECKPTETQLAELGESLLSVVKAALSGTN